MAEAEAGIAARPISAIVADVNAVRRLKVARDEDEHTHGLNALGVDAMKVVHSELRQN